MTETPRPIKPADFQIPRVSAEDIAEVEADPYLLGESPADVEARRAPWEAAQTRQRESRLRMWEARVPTRFRNAQVSDLTADQGAAYVEAWCNRSEPAQDSLTLVLRAEEPGVGKSHAAYAVGNHAVAHGQWALAWTVAKFNDAIRPGNDDTAFDVAQECDLLVLDDLGREKITDWTLERLQTVLDSRWSNEKRTVITTNLDGPDMLARYGDPIVDRITDTMLYFLMRGQSRRRPVPW